MVSRSTKQEREKREAEFLAEKARRARQGDLFDALPDGDAKSGLLDAMTDRVIDLFNNARFEEGDAILEFMPNKYARALLDWYFDEDGPLTFTPPPTTGEHEASQRGQVQGE